MCGRLQVEWLDVKARQLASVYIQIVSAMIDCAQTIKTSQLIPKA